MNSFKRYEEDETLEITSLLNDGQLTRVIRSHRRAPQYTLRPSGRRIIVALLVITISSTIMGTGSTPTDADVTTSVTVAPLDVPASLPELYSETLTEPSAISATPVYVPESPKATEAIKSKVKPRKTSAPSRKVERKVNTPRIEVVIRYALAQRGDPYVWGASGPNAYDCSGLLVRSFKRIGLSLPHFTGALINKGTRVSQSNLKRGDIIFPSSGHVGIYLGNGMMVHASSGKGRVAVAKVYSFYAARRLA